MKTRTLGFHRLTTGLASLSLLAGFAEPAYAQGTPPAPPLDPAPTAPAPAAPAPAAQPAPTTPAEAPAAPVAPTTAPAAAGAATPVAGTAAAPPSGTDVAAEAELTDLEQQLAKKTTDEEDDYKLDIYGFTDFTYGVSVKDFAFGPPYNSFAVGNLNVYLASKLGDSWQSLAEVRFSYLPHGVNTVDSTGQISRVDTTVGDYTDLNRPVRWGSVMIQRAYLEYLAHPLLNIRAGHFLTPYGIWNVDHGSPVIIGVRRPFIVGESLFPQSQTGLEIYGTHHFDPIKLGYHFTLSNGRGPIDTYQDLNGNKAIGGRLFAQADTKVGAITLGMSGYMGRYTDRQQQYVIDPNGDLTVEWPRTGDYDERSFAADLKYQMGGFLLQGEAILNDVVYDEMRPVDPFVLEGPPGYLTDYRRVGVYGLTGYRFDFIGMMPFAGAEFYNAGRTGFSGKSAAFWGGLNVRPTPRVVLKAQYTYSWFPGDPVGVPADSHFNSIDFQAAWSF